MIFVSSNDAVEDRLKAFEAGGDAFIAKPVDHDILLMRISRVLRPHAQVHSLTVEKDTLQQMASDLLEVSGEHDILFGFMHRSLGTPDYDGLFADFIKVLEQLGLSGQVEFRARPGGSRMVAGDYLLSPLEDSLLARGSRNPGVFLYKNRLLINSPGLSLLITNFPSGSDFAARMFGYLETLVNVTESLLHSVAVRQDALETTETLQAATLNAHDGISQLLDDYRRQQADTQILLHGMIEKLERSYYALGLTEGQEARISNLLREETEGVMALFSRGSEEFDRKFHDIMEMLCPSSNDQNDIWL